MSPSYPFYEKIELNFPHDGCRISQNALHLVRSCQRVGGCSRGGNRWNLRHHVDGSIRSREDHSVRHQVQDGTCGDPRQHRPDEALHQSDREVWQQFVHGRQNHLQGSDGQGGQASRIRPPHRLRSTLTATHRLHVFYVYLIWSI